MINEEGLIPCYDIVSIMCDQLLGRLKQIQKFGPPKDMEQTFHTLIYACPRIDIDELMEVRRQLQKILGEKYVKGVEMDDCSVNKIVSTRN